MKIKNYLLLVLIVVSATMSGSTRFKSSYRAYALGINNILFPHKTTLQQVQEATKQFVTDIDDVLMTRKNIIRGQIPAYTKFLKNHATKEQLYTGLTAFTQQLLRHPQKTIRAICQFEEISDVDIAKYGSCLVASDKSGQTFWQRFKQVHADSVQWLYPMVNIIKDIHTKGYAFNIATNQSQAMVDMWLTSKNNPLYKDGISPKVVYSKNTVLSYDGIIIKKPNQCYFESLMNDCKKTYPDTQYFIFADDKKVNVQAAVKVGFVGIVARNANVVRRSLEHLGLLEHS